MIAYITAACDEAAKFLINTTIVETHDANMPQEYTSPGARRVIFTRAVTDTHTHTHKDKDHFCIVFYYQRPST